MKIKIVVFPPFTMRGFILKHVLNSHLGKFFCFAAFLLPSLCFGVGEGGVDDFGMEDHSQICNAKKNMQVLSQPDFDGSGIVDEADLELVKAAVDLANSTEAETGVRKYTAFFDINNDSKLNNLDIAKTKVSANLGKFSTSLDVQVAELYHAAKKYEDISEALKDGYIPFTQEYQNHGIHMIRFLPGEDNVLDEEFNHAAPEGLNYDRYGNLVGVFYYVGPNVATLMRPMFDPKIKKKEIEDIQAYFMSWLAGTNPAAVKPEAFDLDLNGKNHDHWHFHQGVCSRNLLTPVSYGKSVLELSGELIGRAWDDDSIDPQEVFKVADLLDVRQCDILQSCAAEGGVFIPRFFMLHVWLFNANNRCGIFWGTHEDISVNDLAGVDPESIPDESSSFILQAADDILYLDGTVQLDANGDPMPNKNYRKMCLDPSVTAGMVYDNPANPDLDPKMPIGVKQYIQANKDDDDVKQTLVCPPGASATPADEGCRRQQRDLLP